MAKYRVQIDIAFEDIKDAQKLMSEVGKLKKKSYKPKGSEKIPVIRTARYHLCSHDEPNPQPCSGYIYTDFDKA